MKNIILHYYSPGAIIAEEGTRKVDEINPMEHAKELKDYVFEFWYTYSKTLKMDGLDFTSKSRDKTRHYHINAELWNEKIVKSKNINNKHRILLSNMRSNNWDYVIRERTGNVRPYDMEKDAFIKI